MANVTLLDDDTPDVVQALIPIATKPASVDTNEAPTGGTATQAVYELLGVDSGAGITVAGEGLTYNTAGDLVGGLITSLSYTQEEDLDLSTSQLVFANIALPVAEVTNLANQSGAFDAQTILGPTNNVFTIDGSTLTVFGQQNTINVTGTGQADLEGMTPPGPVTVTGGPGAVDTLDIATLRSLNTVTGSAGSESVSLPVPITATGIDQLQFIDGSVYQAAATLGGQVALLFQGLLGRAPGPVALGYYTADAQQYGITAVAAGILGSTEGQADTASLSNQAYVTLLYQGILLRAPDPTGLAYWTMALGNGVLSRATVAAAFVTAPEAAVANNAAFATGQVFGADTGSVDALFAYETVLGRVPDAAGLTAFTQAVDSGATMLAQAYHGLINSSEFAHLLGAPLTNASFVNQIQLNVYGAVNASATQYWSGLLAAGQVTPAAVAQAYATAPDVTARFSTLVTGQGVAHS